MVLFTIQRDEECKKQHRSARIDLVPVYFRWINWFRYRAFLTIEDTKWYMCTYTRHDTALNVLRQSFSTFYLFFLISLQLYSLWQCTSKITLTLFIYFSLIFLKNSIFTFVCVYIYIYLFKTTVIHQICNNKNILFAPNTLLLSVLHIFLYFTNYTPTIRVKH